MFKSDGEPMVGIPSLSSYKVRCELDRAERKRLPFRRTAKLHLRHSCG